MKPVLFLVILSLFTHGSIQDSRPYKALEPSNIITTSDSPIVENGIINDLQSIGVLPHSGYEKYMNESYVENSISLDRGFDGSSEHVFYWSPRTDHNEILLFNSTSNHLLLTSDKNVHITMSMLANEHSTRSQSGTIGNYNIDPNSFNGETPTQFNIVQSYKDIPYDIDWFYLDTVSSIQPTYNNILITDEIVDDLVIPLPLEVAFTPDKKNSDELVKTTTAYFSSNNTYKWYSNDESVDHSTINAYATVLSDPSPHTWNLRIIGHYGPRSTPDKHLIAQKSIYTTGENLFETLDLSINQNKLLSDQYLMPQINAQYELQIYLDSVLFIQSFFQISENAQDIYAE